MEIKLTHTQLKSVQEYCKLNNIEDVNKFIIKCYTEGFNINKYGMIGDNAESNVSNNKELERLRKLVKIYEMDQHNSIQDMIEINNKVKSLEKQLEESPVEVVKYVETPVEIIKEIEVVQYVDREVIKEVPVEIIKEKIVNVVQEVPVDKSNDKVLLLQETLQKLRKELTEKNSRITELEEINKQLESIKVSQGAVYLKGSNINETM